MLLFAYLIVSIIHIAIELLMSAVYVAIGVAIISVVLIAIYVALMFVVNVAVIVKIFIC